MAMVVVEFFTNPANYKVIGWGGSFVSATIAYLVSVQLRDNPRMAAVMALFACGWVLRMGAYAAPVSNNELVYIVSDMASFLFVFVGALLVTESPVRLGPFVSSLVQAIAFGLSFLILWPSGMLVPGWRALNPYESQLLGGVALGMVAWVSIALGAWGISSRRSFRLLLTILLLYTLISGARAVQLWADYQPMDGFFVYAFAFAKIALTCVLSYIVVGHATRIKEKPQPGQAVGTMTSSGSVPGV